MNMNTTEITFTIDQLRSLIGTRVEHEGMVCEIIEILEDDPALILQECEIHTIIQADQHGEAHRRVPTTRTVPILNPDRTEYNPAFLNLDVLNELIS